MPITPAFNLWFDPWIGVTGGSGAVQSMSICGVLHNAHQVHGLYDNSPLIEVGVQRFLTAILQDALQPRTNADLSTLWRDGRFPVAALERFGAAYAQRFDLFAADVPFMQSADLPPCPSSLAKTKTVGYLFEDLPAGTAVTHYNHRYETDHTLCAACTAHGLVTLPAFASSGGVGVRPSINGVPPIYVMPGGSTLFEQLTASLLTPAHYPPTTLREDGLPAWRRDAVITKKSEVSAVGYLDGLTFAARRVRLHPERMDTPCTRCGARTRWSVKTMAFEMGTFRPKTAALWRDPFVAYRIPRDGKTPRAIRPIEGRAVWREFGNLFLTSPAKRQMRPAVIDQLEQIRSALPYGELIPFKTVGLRTDGKMKRFEWQESAFRLPAVLLDDLDTAAIIEQAIALAHRCERILAWAFSKHFSDSAAAHALRGTRSQTLTQTYWHGLATPFRHFVLQFSSATDMDALERYWAEQLFQHALTVFQNLLAHIGRNSGFMRRCVAAELDCRRALYRMTLQPFQSGGHHAS